MSKHVFLTSGNQAN